MFLSFFRRSSVSIATIPLDRDATGRFLPFIIAALVLLSSLMLVLAQGLSGALTSWRSGLEGHATVQVMPLQAGATSLDERISRVLGILQGSPLVHRAAPVSDDKMAELLSPWLGQGALPEELPVPALIDVELASSRADLTSLRTLLAAVPGTTLDDHGSWLQQVRVLAQAGVVLVLGLLLLIGGAAAMVLVLLVRAGMATHRDVIELLHLVGATDAFIIHQFRRHMTALALRGALLGALLAALALLVLERLAASAGFALQVVWGILPVMPVFFILLAGFTAQRVTASRLEDLP